jgi:hypothetical protein
LSSWRKNEIMRHSTPMTNGYRFACILVTIRRWVLNELRCRHSLDCLGRWPARFRWALHEFHPPDLQQPRSDQRLFQDAPFSSLFALFPETDARAIFPENLTELGRQYQKQAIRNEWMAVAWGLCGFAIMASVLEPFKVALLTGALAVVLAGFYFWGPHLRPQEMSPSRKS